MVAFGVSVGDAAIIAVTVTAILVGVTTALRKLRLVSPATEGGWQEEAELQKARADRQEKEIIELRGTVLDLTQKLGGLAAENKDLRGKVEELLSRPDFAQLSTVIRDLDLHLRDRDRTVLDLLGQIVAAVIPRGA